MILFLNHKGARIFIPLHYPDILYDRFIFGSLASLLAISDDDKYTLYWLDVLRTKNKINEFFASRYILLVLIVRIVSSLK